MTAPPPILPMPQATTPVQKATNAAPKPMVAQMKASQQMKTNQQMTVPDMASG